ncbi:exodeoxyribonuclease VII large subunit [Legionella adelaidensis]|nr:exodeoxyribonuclease VII large subunit [Legionella adelaidensis]
MITTTPLVLTVTQLNRQIKNWLELEMGVVCVEGEISNLAKPSSGHFYFTLKDSKAQVRCVYFRNRHGPGNQENWENGQQVIATGILSLYEARGDYQLIVNELKLAGAGNLFQQFEQLKKKLATLGLFETERKRPLPTFPYTIGVVTSESAAALRDILTTLARRFPVAQVVIYPSEVQGKSAAKQLSDAILLANKEKHCDVLLLARGGGSMEDLWAFNDEQLAFTIFNSAIPIVSGVGHETDFTIADFVADLRAATPTAAAEAVTPNIEDIIRYFQLMEAKLADTLSRLVAYKRLLVEHKIQKISSPGRLIMSHWQTLDFLKNRLVNAMQNGLLAKRQSIHLAQSCLVLKNPVVLVQQSKRKVSDLRQRISQLIVYKKEMLTEQLAKQMATLHVVSPLATLERGYSIVTKDEKIICDVKCLKKDDVIEIQLANGSVVAGVKEVTGKGSP